MAFDAKYLSCVLGEIREKCLGARVEKIHQPSRDEILLHIRGKNCSLPPIPPPPGCT